MSIALIVTEGFGNGTLVGSIPDVVTLGYAISTIIPPTIPVADGISVSGQFGDGVNTSGGFGEGEAVTSVFGNGATVRGKL